MKLSLDIVLEAHGLGFEVSSKKATFNFDSHAESGSVHRLPHLGLVTF
jgi:hypothetical protein